MYFKIFREESGQSLPLIVGIIFLVVALLFFSLSLSNLALERTDQQAIADAAALAGANSLSKAFQTMRAIDFLIWSRNVMVNLLYTAATIATIATSGGAASLYSIPVRFQQATAKIVDALEKTKKSLAELAPIYAVGNSLAYIKANSQGRYTGFALPLPLRLEPPTASEREKDLLNKLKWYEERLQRARQELIVATENYLKKKEELERKGLTKEEMAKDPEFQQFRDIFEEKRGRVGGLTRWRNETSRQLLEEQNKKKKKFWGGGEDGILVIVVHSSENIPFSQFFGGTKTGTNIALAAADAEDTPESMVIGEEAIKNLFSNLPLLRGLSQGLVWLLDSINIFGQRMENIKGSYGGLGVYLFQALNNLRIVPPKINQLRPGLKSIRAATKDTSFWGTLSEKLEKFRDFARKMEKKYGQKFLEE